MRHAYQNFNGRKPIVLHRIARRELARDESEAEKCHIGGEREVSSRYYFDSSETVKTTNCKQNQGVLSQYTILH